MMHSCQPSRFLGKFPILTLNLDFLISIIFLFEKKKKKKEASEEKRKEKSLTIQISIKVFQIRHVFFGFFLHMRSVALLAGEV